MSDQHWTEAAQLLAADNARLCGRLLTAEAVVEAARRYTAESGVRNRLELLRLIEAHDAGKPS